MKKIISVGLFFYMSLVGLSVMAVNSQYRVQSLYLNRNSAQKVYLVPGLASSVHMPCEIDEIVSPTNGILHQISDRNKNRFSIEVTVGSRPTNFIVHCVNSSYVFDLLVNDKIHNDLIEVEGDYGKPRLTQSLPFEKPHFVFKKQSASIIGFKKDGSRVVLEDYKKTLAQEKSDSKVDETEYSKIQKILIYDSKESGGSNDH
jgi:hypothetical protein